MGGQVIPIDGKTVRGSYDRNQNKSALHLISAWASKQRLVLAQMKVDDKSNEITAIPALLELIDIAGSIITIDAMGTGGGAAQAPLKWKLLKRSKCCIPKKTSVLQERSLRAPAFSIVNPYLEVKYPSRCDLFFPKVE
jgi:hypothetical protein